MEGSEGFACQVCYPDTEIVVTRRGEAALFAVKGVTDRELGLAAVAVCREVWGINAIPQEEDVTTFLCPQLRPIDLGRLMGSKHKIGRASCLDPINHGI